LSKLTKP